MAITAEFRVADDTFTFQNIPGYRISFCMTPGQSYQGHYYVYLVDRIEAQSTITSPIAPGTKMRRGTLDIVGNQRSYTFKDIDLYSVETIINYRERMRLVCFKYDDQLTSRHALPAQLKNSADNQPELGPLNDDYNFKLEGTLPKRLLAYQLMNGSYFSTVMRLATLRDESNSLLERIIEANDQEVVSQDPFRPFTISLSSNTVDLDPRTLEHAFIDESFGLFLDYPSPTLTTLTENAHPAQAALQVPYYSHRDLLSFVGARGLPPSKGKDTVETATFVFREVYRDLAMV
ncbi:hypothetical protein [Acanthopleuribacter pedis]|uniref:Uncharacterized protein n=1 Tax=Acanthopleuribacter pedis TaxID=442870 RepID=A0A8J7U577_9BACT|nr:hypothetical protein [Acanthopleuribacter pedis]MBO1321437.1 hypothetical protein [Acanthopleuribacter pedis]